LSGGATPDVDYTHFSINLIFEHGATTATLNFTDLIIDDSDVEQNEDFQLSLSNPTQGAGLGEIIDTIITIIDDDVADPGELRLDSALYSVNENEQEILIGVQRVNGTDGPASVLLFTETLPGGASDLTDFDPIEVFVTFAAGVGGTQYFPIHIDNDQIPEDPEDFLVYLTEASGAIIVTPGQATVTIIDDDGTASPGVLEIDQHQYNVDEGAGSVVIRVMRVDGVFGEVGATVRTDIGTATPNEDYVAASQFVTFGHGDSTTKEIHVLIEDDEETEDTETFEVVLSSPTGGVELGFPKQGTVNILDNDQPIISWRSGLITRLEETTITLGITAELDIPFASGATIPVDIGGTAVLDSDYTLSGSSLVFTPGNTVAELTLGLIDDALVEADETIVFTLSEGTAMIGSPSVHTLTLVNDDSSEVNWRDLPARISEGGSNKRDTTVTVEAELSHPVDFAVSIPYTVGGTATLGDDHDLQDGTLLFAAGSQIASLSFTLVDDSSPESVETLVLSLLPDVGISAGDGSLATILIEDNDSLSVSWASTRQELEEDDSSGKRAIRVQVEAQLSNAVADEIRVPFCVSGSADVGVDHNLEAGELVFGSGETSKFLTFDVLADNIQEYNETVLLTLESGSVSVGEKRVHKIVINDNDRGQAPGSKILDVGRRIILAVDTVKTLHGSGLDPQGDQMTYAWKVCSSIGDCEVFEAQDLDLVRSQVGEYVVFCAATDVNGNTDPTPAFVKVKVVEKLPPTVTISNNFGGLVDDQIAIPLGTMVDFEAMVAVSEQASKAETFEWFFIDTPNSRTSGSTFSFPFDEAGEFTLAVKATSDGGAQATASISISVAEEVLPTVAIVFPVDGETALVGEDVAFLADVLIPSEKRRALDISWVTGDHRQNPSGQNPDIEPYEKSGQYQVRVIVRDRESGYQVEDQVTLFIRDPETAPVVDFAFPTDINIESEDVGKRQEMGAVFFNALVRDSKGYQNLTYFWDFDGVRATNETPGYVFFSPGTHTVSLFALGEDGMQSETVTRTIVVGSTDDNDFEPNDSAEQAPLILPGRYSNLNTDDAAATDYYRVSVPQDGQRLLLGLDVDGPTSLSLFDASVLANSDIAPLAERQFTAKGNLQVENLSAGDYYIRLKPTESSAKRTVNFGLSVSILNPALYFPDIQMNETVDTFVGVVNTSNAEVSVEAIGYDADGNLLGRVQQALPAKGRSHQSVGQLFGELAADVAWVQYDASGAVEGYAITESRDFKEVYAVSASKKLSSELYVPHIAQRVEDWFTKAAVINGNDQALNSIIQTPGDSEELFLDRAFGKDSFDFLTRFGGNFSQGQVQAVFKDLDEKASLAGIEVFGFLREEDRVVAGLGLADARKDNPNFTYIANNIYFTHIARNTDFYTGIALVNIGNFEQGVLIRAYGDGGAEVGQKVRTLAAGEKLVETATVLLEGIGSPQDVDWILVEADEDVVGFELFGTNDGKRLAGLEASTGLTTEICYPFFNGNPAVAHGISVINVDPDPETNPDDLTVTFILYADSGSTIGQPRTVNIKPNQKYIGLIRDIFSEDLEDSDQIPGWLCASADAPMAGFELFIRGDEMGAITSQ